MSAIAKISEIRMSPRKVAEVASLVRGRSVEDALVILEHIPRSAAKPLSKVIASAKANAENNHGLSSNGLTIVSLDIGHGTPLKRFRPVARGSAHPYKSRTTNIRVEVDGEAKKSKSKTKTTTKKSDSEKSDKEDSKKSESNTKIVNSKNKEVK